MRTTNFWHLLTWKIVPKREAAVNCVRDHPYVVATPRPEPPKLSGTAFFVAPYRVVTNNHVVRDCKSSIEIKFANQPSYTAYIDAQDDVNDLALLHSNLISPSFA